MFDGKRWHEKKKQRLATLKQKSIVFTLLCMITIVISFSFSLLLFFFHTASNLMARTTHWFGFQCESSFIRHILYSFSAELFVFSLLLILVVFFSLSQTFLSYTLLLFIYSHMCLSQIYLSICHRNPHAQFCCGFFFPT